MAGDTAEGFPGGRRACSQNPPPDLAKGDNSPLLHEFEFSTPHPIPGNKTPILPETATGNSLFSHALDA